MNKSLDELPRGHPEKYLECPQPNCRANKSSKKGRKANRACGRSPQWCSNCCIANGGCSLHKPTSLKSPSTSPAVSPPVAAAPIPNTSVTTAIAASTDEPLPPKDNPAGRAACLRVTAKSYARPLPEDYGEAKTITHQKKFASNQKVEDRRAIDDAVKSTIVVVIWLQVCYSCLNTGFIVMTLSSGLLEQR